MWCGVGCGRVWCGWVWLDVVGLGDAVFVVVSCRVVSCRVVSCPFVSCRAVSWRAAQGGVGLLDQLQLTNENMHALLRLILRIEESDHPPLRGRRAWFSLQSGVPTSYPTEQSLEIHFLSEPFRDRTSVGMGR